MKSKFCAVCQVLTASLCCCIVFGIELTSKTDHEEVWEILTAKDNTIQKTFILFIDKLCLIEFNVLISLEDTDLHAGANTKSL